MEFSHEMTNGAEAYVDSKFAEAARHFGLAAAMHPENGQAQFWAGQAYVYGRQPVAAIPYLEAAQRDGVDSLALHLALVAACAGAGQAAELDRERFLLHGWHDDGKHGELSRQEGFLLETFFTRRWHVNVLEYFGPTHDGDLLWKFTVRDPAEQIEMVYFLERVSQPGRSETYALVRRIKHPGELDEEHRVRAYPSLPAYATVKEDVTRKLRFQLPNGS